MSGTKTCETCNGLGIYLSQPVDGEGPSMEFECYTCDGKGYVMSELGTPRIAEIDGKPKARGAGQPPRKYTVREWIVGYLAWLLVFPIYLALWAYASAFGRIPQWLVRKLLREHTKTTMSRPRDIRIPGTPTVPPYMLRWWRIKRNAFFNIYYHLVYRSDDDAALHDHPWWSFSIVLEGGYFEHRIADGGINTKRWYGPGSVLFRRSGTQAHQLELAAHSVNEIEEHDGFAYAEKSATTIFITGPVLRRWGFHHTERWVDAYEWDEYLQAKGIRSMKMEGYADQLRKGSK